jgi:hypothetical protein
MKLLMNISFIILLISTVSSQENTKFPYWLEGTWEIESDFGFSYERWEKMNDSLLIGKAYRMFDDDTVIFDNMRIIHKSNGIFLEMTAARQAQQEIALFKLQQPAVDLWKFENPEVEFPKNINYHKKDENSVYVWTETDMADVECVDFVMKRKK